MRRVNVDAPFHIARAAFPLLKRQGYGRFVFTTSGRAMSMEDTRPASPPTPSGRWRTSR